MSQGNGDKSAEARKLLIERVAASRYVNRSARLRDLLLYLTTRVLEPDAAGEIHEQEVGHKVFGRPANYDTGIDNIVRVHASMLRKRLEQYFAEEGRDEPIILEIPKGNYAPVFREREEALPAIALAPAAAPPSTTPATARPLVAIPLVEIPAIPWRLRVPHAADWRLWTAGLLALLFACSTALLLLRGAPEARALDISRPTVKLFWSQVFHTDRPTDIVFGDAAIALYQELTGRALSLSDYYDRGYMRSLPESAAAANLHAQAAIAVARRRETNFADMSFAWKLLQIPGAGQRPSVLRFARDYSFRELKANNAVLIGNSRSNPWVEPFEPKLGIRWIFDKTDAVYDPVDTWAGGKSYQAHSPGDLRESYFSVALLPNLGGTGNVLIISGTGGSAINAGADFLADEPSVAGLRRRLPGTADKPFPHFEALIKVKGRSSLPRDATVLACRTPRV